MSGNRFKEWFRGEQNIDWSKGDVYLDKGYTDPKYYTTRLNVGSCSMIITVSEAEEILEAVRAAEARREDLLNDKNN